MKNLKVKIFHTPTLKTDKKSREKNCNIIQNRSWKDIREIKMYVKMFHNSFVLRQSTMFSWESRSSAWDIKAKQEGRKQEDENPTKRE